MFILHTPLLHAFTPSSPLSHPSPSSYLFFGSIQGSESVDSTTSSLPTKSDLTRFIHKRITNQWNSLRQNQASSNKLTQIKPLPFSWSSSHQTHRRQEIYLTRLRIGHTHITHAYLLSNLFSLSCEHCSLDSPLTVNHMFECPVLTALRLMHHVPQGISLQQLHIHLQYFLLPPGSKLPFTHLIQNSLPPSS